MEDKIEIIKRGNKGFEVSSKNEYVNGVRHGKQKTFYENGGLWIEFYAKNGLNHGLRMNFNTDKTRGYILQEKNGFFHGSMIHFRYERDELFFKNGKLKR